MYTVSIEARFSAIHAVRLADGTLERAHGHDWVVRAFFCRVGLNDLGMVVDFVPAQEALNRAVEDFQYADLNEHEAFAGHNPTAEVVAWLVHDRLRRGGMEAVRRVEVTEAPGCVAGYEPDRLDENSQRAN